jgi:hypothetical protein
VGRIQVEYAAGSVHPKALGAVVIFHPYNREKYSAYFI